MWDRAILVAGLAGLKKAGDVENQVAKEIAKMDVDEAKKRKLIAVLDAVLARVAEKKDSTVRLKNELENLLAASSFDNAHDAYRAAKVATSLRELLDTPILDKRDGRVI